MFNIFLFSSLSSTIFYICGSIFFLKTINKKQTIEEISSQSIFGIIFISFVALVLNFFVPLNKEVNSVFLLTFLITFILIFKKKINFYNLFYFSIISGATSFLLLMLSHIYNPDGGLYHYPYVNILNNEKIILGLSNLHFRYGHISIIQYTSAFFYNFLFNLNGIVIPLASLSSFIILNFLFKIFDSLKKKEINFYLIFLVLILVYISYKMNRYSGYGNDAPAHFLFFYLVSEIFKKKSIIVEHKFNLLLISVFIFLNKITMGLAILLPLVLINFKKLKKYNYISLYFSVLLFLFWLLKTLLISGCLIYPVKSTCIKNLEWTNINQTKMMSVQSEAWSKGWPDRKNKDIKMEDFNKKFNWLNAWFDVHFKRICKILLPYLFFLTAFYLFLIFIKKRPKLKKVINYKNSFNVNFIFFISLFGCLMWFLKFPIYRYGYSYLITVLVILFSNILYKEIIFFNFKNQKKIILTIVILSISTLFIKQSVRIAKNYNYNYNNYPWPKYYDYSMDNNIINTSSKLINGKLIYKSSTYCMYSKAPCTNEEIDIKISEKNNYLIFN